jgi:hypothetical protein
MSSSRDQIFIEQVANPEDLAFVDFYEEKALIEVPGTMLAYMPFETREFIEDAAFRAELDRIRTDGFDSEQPITLEPRPGGRWVVDAHDAARFEAARKVAGEVFSNFFSQKVRKVRFVLLATSYDGQFKASRKHLNYRAN